MQSTSPLATVDAWARATPRDRDAAVVRLARRLGEAYRVLAWGTYADAPYPIASIGHVPSQVVFRVVPGGTFEPGLSASEESMLLAIAAAADERDAASVDVEVEAAYGQREVRRTVDLSAGEQGLLADIDRAFGLVPAAEPQIELVTLSPPSKGPQGPRRPEPAVSETGDEIRAMVESLHTIAPAAAACTVGCRLVARHPLSERQVQTWLPGFRSAGGVPRGYDEGALFDNLDDVQTLCQRACFAVPTVAQHEHAARGDRRHIHYSGRIPTEEDLEVDFEDLVGMDDDDDVEPGAMEHRFGLLGLGALPELLGPQGPVQGRWSAAAGVFRAHGGAALVSPWQGCGEWISMLSCYRDLLRDYWAVRPVIPAPID